MSALTCDFCGRISTKTEGWRQIFDRSFEKRNDETMMMICPRCHKLIIENTKGAVIDPNLEYDSVKEAMDEKDPGRAYIGTMLRDFLQSPLYLRTPNIYFEDAEGQIIKDYMPCMEKKIIKIKKQDNGRLRVTLNFTK